MSEPMPCKVCGGSGEVELADIGVQRAGTEPCPRCITVMLRQAERRIRRLEAVEAAARRVSSAAWTDRWARLHGHVSIEALDVALKHIAPNDGQETA